MREGHSPTQANYQKLDLKRLNDEWPELVAGVRWAVERLERESIFDESRLPTVAVLPVLSVWSYQLDGIFIGATRTAEMRNGILIAVPVYLAAAHGFTALWGNHGLWAAIAVLMVMRTLPLAIWYPRIERAIESK